MTEVETKEQKKTRSAHASEKVKGWKKGIGKRYGNLKKSTVNTKKNFAGQKLNKKQQFQKLEEFRKSRLSGEAATIYYVDEYGDIKDAILISCKNSGMGKKLGLGKGYQIKIQYDAGDTEDKVEKIYTDPTLLHLSRESAYEELAEKARKLQERQSLKLNSSVDEEQEKVNEEFRKMSAATEATKVPSTESTLHEMAEGVEKLSTAEPEKESDPGSPVAETDPTAEEVSGDDEEDSSEDDSDSSEDSSEEEEETSEAEDSSEAEVPIFTSGTAADRADVSGSRRGSTDPEEYKIHDSDSEIQSASSKSSNQSWWRKHFRQQ